MPIIEAWASYRTGNATQWTARQLARAKGGTTVSVVIPARNEQDTIGAIVTTIRRELIQRVPLVDEIVVVDSRSTDATAALARAAGRTPPLHALREARALPTRLRGPVDCCHGRQVLIAAD